MESSDRGEPTDVTGRVSLPITREAAFHPSGAKRWTDRFSDCLVCERFRAGAGYGCPVAIFECHVDDASLKLLHDDDEDRPAL